MYLVVKHLRSLLHCGVVHCTAYIHLGILTQAMMRYLSSLMTMMMMIMSQDSDSSDEEMSVLLDDDDDDDQDDDDYVSGF